MAPRAARSGILTIVIGTRKRFFAERSRRRTRPRHDRLHPRARLHCATSAPHVQRWRRPAELAAHGTNAPPQSSATRVDDCRYRHNGWICAPLARSAGAECFTTCDAHIEMCSGSTHGHCHSPASSNDGKCRCAGGAAELSAILRGRAEVAESVDAADSKSAALKSVWVRVPPSAPGLTAASAAVCFLCDRRGARRRRRRSQVNASSSCARLSRRWQ